MYGHYRNVLAARKQKFAAPGENTEGISERDMIGTVERPAEVAKTLTVQALTRVGSKLSHLRTWGNYHPKKVFWRRARVTILPSTFHRQHI